MAGQSAIEWTDATFNPWSGCTKVSPACQNCYAEVDRSVKIRGVQWGPNGNRVVKAESGWKEPLKWDRQAAAAGTRKRVFCASLADVFEDWQGTMTNATGQTMYRSRTGGWIDNGPSQFSSKLTMNDVRARLFKLIDATPNLDWLLLTKRPENVMPMTPARDLGERAENIAEGDYHYFSDADHAFRRPNVWIGTTAENQEEAEKRIPHLLKVPAALRFLSCEPLLGPIDLTRLWLSDKTGYWNAFTGKLTARVALYAGGEVWVETERAIAGTVGWAIAGGESGHRARPSHVEWFRSLRDQCTAAGVPFFFKQWGEFATQQQLPPGHPRHHAAGTALVQIGKRSAGNELDGRTWEQFPTAFRD
jgi:protein gp37